MQPQGYRAAEEVFDLITANFAANFATLQAQDTPSTSTAFGNYTTAPFGEDRNSEPLGYCGYINNEYDLAATCFLAYEVTGNQAYRTYGVRAARNFRDFLVSPDGGCYQHRATRMAPLGHIVQVLLQANPDQTAEAGARLVNTRVQANGTAFAQHPAVAGSLQNYAAILATDPVLSSLGYNDAEAQFEPFFQQYGGSWDDFPRMQEDIFPDPSRYSGGHSLMGALAKGAKHDGPESYRDALDRVARHHIDVLGPKLLQDSHGSDGRRAREMAWPLINLLDYMEVSYPNTELYGAVLGQARTLARWLSDIPPEDYGGAIHFAVTLEALSRFHEKFGGEDVAGALREVTIYWTKHHWIQSQQGFASTPLDRRVFAFNTGLAFYGVWYTHKKVLSKSTRWKNHLRGYVRDMEEIVGSMTLTNARDFAGGFRAWRVYQG